MRPNSNIYKNQKLRGLKRKYEVIQKRGGKCEMCGYNKNIAAFDFHHKDPSIKKYALDMRAFSNFSLDKLETELDKCLLLCSNCHREVHHSDLMMSNVKIISDNNKKSFKTKHGSVCPVCKKRFPKSTRKIFCSKECNISSKNYPSLENILIKYNELNNWEKVAKFYNISRRVIYRIRYK